MDVKVYHKKSRVPGLVIEAKNHITTLTLFFLFFIGLICGTLSVKFENSISDIIVLMFKQYNGLIVSYGFIKNFLNLFFNNIFVIISMFFFGLCAIGTPFVCLIPLVKGIGIGVVSAYMYKSYLMSGFGYCTIVYYPPQIINMLCIIIGANESYINSKNLFYMMSSSKQYEFDGKIYIIRYILILLLTIISSSIGAVLNTFLSNAFIS